MLSDLSSQLMSHLAAAPATDYTEQMTSWKSAKAAFCECRVSTKYAINAESKLSSTNQTSNTNLV